MAVYYNEIDPQKAAWLRELIARNLIAPGDVDERSIVDVRPDDLRGYRQCHFFAGIGTWSYALRCAGWPDEREVWTGSCPCQPFSAAGQRKAFDDERHLWPAWFQLIQARRPLVCFGEQVASIDGLAWLDAVYSDLDGAGYTCGAVDLCAAGFGAPHRRQRLYWVADAATVGYDGRGAGEAERRAGQSQRFCDAGGVADGQGGRWREERAVARRINTGNGAQGRGAGSHAGGDSHIVADSDDAGLAERGCESAESGPQCAATERARNAEFLADSLRDGAQRAGSEEHILAPGRTARGMENPLRSERWPDQREQNRHRQAPGRDESPNRPGERSETERLADPDHERREEQRLHLLAGQSPESVPETSGRGAVNGFWRDANWVLTRPQRVGERPGLRPVESCSFPLAPRTPARVGRLRGYGDSLAAPVAQAFIEAYLGSK